MLYFFARIFSHCYRPIVHKLVDLATRTDTRMVVRTRCTLTVSGASCYYM